MGPRSKRRIGQALGFFAVLGLVAYAVGATGRTASSTFSHTGTFVETSDAASGGRAIAGPVNGLAKPVPTAPQAAPPTSAQAANNAQTLPNVGDKISRTADLTVEVKKGTFEAAWQAAFRIAAQNGGQIMSSSTGIQTPVPVPLQNGTRASSEKSPPIGDITIRIPAGSFIKTTNALRGLGIVRGDNTTTEDVSQEYVDLQSRLRNLRAEQNTLLALFRRAQTINDTLTVQRQVSDVEGQIEQVTGRIKYLDARTVFSTVTIHLQEPGVAIITVVPKNPSLGGAWETAKTGLVRIVGAVMIVGLALAPITALALIGFAVWRRTRRAAPQV